jgi:hypothetical protein
MQASRLRQLNSMRNFDATSTNVWDVMQSGCLGRICKEKTTLCTKTIKNVKKMSKKSLTVNLKLVHTCLRNWYLGKLQFLNAGEQNKSSSHRLHIGPSVHVRGNSLTLHHRGHLIAG